ncbi:restriction endonuclease subunit S [Vibrio parahaemolyticus]|uniref:restriction endonuclease subunit S n=1 Tax=Vibrio parahaemolyticus TaxID=670 RepID=UPI000B92431E|nr:restriction endonuclease subunit S [Vibrio parahaemolyticus]OXD48572.1 restriction endonuclease [Vibrio parahaemolyticus]
MSKKGKKALEPKLRFKRDDGSDFSSWSVKPLKEMAVRCTKKNGAEDVGRVLTNSASGGVVDQRDYFEKDIANKDNLGGYYIVEKDAYVYNPRISSLAPVGPISKNKVGKGVMSPLYTVFKFNDNNNDFYEYYFKSNQWHDYMRKVSNTGVRHDRMNVTNDDFMSMPMPYPEKGERDKIADCLSSIDELIEAEGEKLDELKAHKKGLVQQLFPSNGKTVPQLRFPEFQNDKGWMREELFNILDKIIDYRGKAPPKAEIGVPLITAKNVRSGWLDMSCDEYIAADKYESWMSKGMPKAGDILFTTEAPLGHVAFFPSDGKFALGQRILTLRTKPEKCIPEFLFQSLLGPQMQNEINFNSTGSTAKGIKSSVFSRIGFCYPEIPEQRKIASFLSSIDKLILSEAKKVEKLKEYKKGLMQQLFPSIEGVDL